jgi:hypothetical protein
MAAMAITRLTNFTELVEYLSENSVPHASDPAGQVVELPVTSPPLSGMLYIRWERKLPYVQIIHPFIGNVPEDRIRAVETAICRANTIIALPGLGYEYDKRFIYMRLCVPMYEEGMASASFQRQILAVLQNARDFIAAFRDIVAGAPGEQIMALAVKHKTETEASTATAKA